MYSRMAQYHPKEVFPVRFQNFEGSQSNRQLEERGAVVSIGSVQNPEALRSDDLKLAHCTEVGLWEDTPKRKAADVIQSVVGSIPDDPYTSVVLESTAKGVGNYFHDTWIKAEKGENGFKPVFVAWFEIGLYYRRFRTEQEKSGLCAQHDRRGNLLFQPRGDARRSELVSSETPHHAFRLAYAMRISLHPYRGISPLRAAMSITRTTSSE